jgi:hypothetical protein
MARGNFRTSKNICLYCGARAENGNKMFKRGLKRQPDYLCGRCFDNNASEQEKIDKEKLEVKFK